jgi:hypothetical protein
VQKSHLVSNKDVEFAISLFEAIDLSGNGSINVKEYCTALSIFVSEKSLSDTLEIVFHLYDLQGTDGISSSEMVRLEGGGGEEWNELNKEEQLITNIFLRDLCINICNVDGGCIVIYICICVCVLVFPSQFLRCIWFVNIHPIYNIICICILEFMVCCSVYIRPNVQENSLLAMSQAMEMKQISGAESDQVTSVRASVKSFVATIFKKYDAEKNDVLSYSEFREAVASYPVLIEIAQGWVKEKAAEFFNLSSANANTMDDKKE